MKYDVDEECWLRIVRRRGLLLCVIYCLNQKLASVTVSKIRSFMSVLKETSLDIYTAIVKPNRPLEQTLQELRKNGLIFLDGEEIKVNEDKVRSEKDLMYWEDFGSEIEGAFDRYIKSV